MKKYLSLIILCVLTSCGGPNNDDRPPHYFQPSSIWMNRLNLVMQHDSSLNRYVMKYSKKTITLEPALSKVHIGNKVIILNNKPRVWNGDVYLSNTSIDQIKSYLPQKHVPKTHKFRLRPEWEPDANSQNRKWKYIVIHHSASEHDTVDSIDRAHKAIGYDCIGYHFVIGNGVNTINGKIETGTRWPIQKHGAHARATTGTLAYTDNRYNRQGIGICLVGNFMHGNEPSKAQMNALVELVNYLQKRYGIKKDNVIPHKHVKGTLCPGDSFPWQSFKARLKN